MFWKLGCFYAECGALMNVFIVIDIIPSADAATNNSLGFVGACIVVALILFWYYFLPFFWRSRASTFLKQKRFEAAILAFDKALKISPHDAKLWFGKGVTLHRVGRLNESFEALRRAEELEPGQTGVAFELAQVLRSQRHYRASLEEIDRAIRLSSSPFNAMLTRCAIKIEGQMFEEAERDCDRLIALEIESIDAETYNLRGVARLALGKIDDARADFETSYLLDPQVIETRVYCAAIWYRRNLFNQTVLLCDSVLRIDEKNALAFYYKGLAERSLGRDGEAERDLKKSRELKQGSPTDTMTQVRRQDLF